MNTFHHKAISRLRADLRNQFRIDSRENTKSLRIEIKGLRTRSHEMNEIFLYNNTQ